MNRIIISSHDTSVFDSNKVIRNTYFLLGLTLSFSALVSIISILFSLPSPGIILTLVGFYGLMFLTNYLANHPAGILSAFAFTGFLGYCLGPILDRLLMVGMGDVIALSLVSTALIFFCCSSYVLTTRRDMTFLSSFLIAGFVILSLLTLASLFLNISGLQLAISAMFVLFSSIAILWETDNILKGGETNYIRATVSLYVSIYNIFVSLLNLISITRDN